MLSHRVVAGRLEQLAVVQPDGAHQAGPQAAAGKKSPEEAKGKAATGRAKEEKGPSAGKAGPRK